MSDQTPGYPPTRPTPPDPQVPPAHAADSQAPVATGQPVVTAAPPQPPRRSRAWIFWTIGIVVFIVLIVASCAIPLSRLGSRTPRATAFGQAVGVIHVDGIIAGTGSGFDGYVTPEAFRELLKQAENDDSIKAVVLRVDSPGGTVAASEEIAAYAKEFSKPLVTSIGDVGASGAYMLASQSDEIWAMPGSAVGSIGVIIEIPNVSGLLDKVGVDFTVVTAGKYKDAGSPYRELTKEELALIQGEVDDAYRQFVGIVADGRGMSESEVESLATGWAWNGERAQELGLIDQIGTFDAALDSAAKLGGIDGDYDVIEIEPDDFDELFGSLLGVARRLDQLGALAELGEVGTRSTVPR